MANSGDFEALLTACLSIDNQVWNYCTRMQPRWSGGCLTARGPAAAARLLTTDSLDTQVRKHAEDTIKQLSARPEVIPELLQRVQAAANPQIRQLAAVLLRKWIARHWSKLTPEVSMQQL